MGIKNRILEQIKLQELPPECYDEPDLLAKLDELEQSNRDILEKYPSRIIQEAVTKKLASSSIKKTVHTTERRRSVLIWTATHTRQVAACAAALCLVVMIPLVVSRSKHTTTAVVQTDTVKSTERTKGNGSHIFLYKKEGKQAVKLENLSEAKAGDIIQISYIASGAQYGVIISIDGSGTITRHYPDHGLLAASLDSNGEIPLDYSYQLDDAPSFERFLLITGNSRFSIEHLLQVLNDIKNTKQAEYADLSQYLPEQTHMNTILLLKQENEK